MLSVRLQISKSIVKLSQKLKTYRIGKQKNERNEVQNLSNEEKRKEVKDLDI